VEDQVSNHVNFTEDGQTKTLGLVWRAHHDTLVYTLKESQQLKITKRRILSEISQIFDPLGLSFKPVHYYHKITTTRFMAAQVDMG